jgi:hypothetical protein
MSEYISRQEAIDKINERQRKLIYCFGLENDMVKIMDIARSIIIAMPSADVVEVVRCNDCKHADEYYHCIFSTIWNDKNHYCGKGERRNG